MYSLQDPKIQLPNRKILNECLESPTSLWCLEFWKEYEEKMILKTKFGLAKIAKRFLTPPPTSTEVERLLSISLTFFQMKETDYCQKTWQKFCSAEKIFQLLTSNVKMSGYVLLFI